MMNRAGVPLPYSTGNERMSVGERYVRPVASLAERVKVMGTNIKLKPEVKAEWLTRLRSGNYRQETGALKRLIRRDGFSRDSDETIFGYCCLGVLSDIYVEKHNDSEAVVSWDIPSLSNGVCSLKDSGYSVQGVPTPNIVKWALVEFDYYDDYDEWHIYVDAEDAEKYKDYVGASGILYLPNANDRGLRFLDIAYLIEKYL